MTTVHSRQLARCLAISIADGGSPAVLHQGRWPPRGDDEMAIYLRQAGQVVERATTGVEAPVRMRRRLASVPYVLLSAASSLPIVASALGARAALAKPVDLDVLAFVNRASRP